MNKVEAVLNVVANHHGTTVEEILRRFPKVGPTTNNRHPQVKKKSHGRHPLMNMTIVLLIQVTGISTTKIGKHINMAESTVRSKVKYFAGIWNLCEKTKKEYNVLLDLCRQVAGPPAMTTHQAVSGRPGKSNIRSIWTSEKKEARALNREAAEKVFIRVKSMVQKEYDNFMPNGRFYRRDEILFNEIEVVSMAISVSHFGVNMTAAAYVYSRDDLGGLKVRLHELARMRGSDSLFNAFYMYIEKACGVDMSLAA
jgi:hypothetical protein